jgi:DNA-binding NarL/FixJ family response regulator
MSSAIARKVISAFHIHARSNSALAKLTQAEMNILHVLATGQSYSAIAATLYISVNTVRTHVRNIYRKLQVHSWKEIKEMDLWGK